MINLDLSKDKYIQIAALMKNRDAPIFPPYKKARKALDKCCPFGVTSTASGANVSWQNLLQHTIERISQIETTAESLNFQVSSKNCREFILLANYGFDGSGQQVQYQQELEKSINDSSVFVTSFIPLKIIAKDTKEVVWINESPHSPRTCRVKKMEFAKETREYVLQEKLANDQEIKELENIVITLASGKLKIFLTKFKFINKI